MQMIFQTLTQETFEWRNIAASPPNLPPARLIFSDGVVGSMVNGVNLGTAQAGGQPLSSPTSARSGEGVRLNGFHPHQSVLA